MLTVEELKQALPPNLRGNATQEFADRVNQIAEDPDVAREVRNNFLTFKRILTEGSIKTEDYLNAVCYCTFKLMGLTNKDSYINTFPDRYQRMVGEGRSQKDISAYIAAFASNKIVNTILEQAYIPIWLLNRDVYQKAINTQMELMQDANSEMVRTTAANSLLLHLKQPEVKKIELDVSLKGNGGLDDLRETMTRLAEQQAQMIADGAGAKTVSRVPLRMSNERPITDVVPIPMPTLPQKLPAPRITLSGSRPTGVVIDDPVPEPVSTKKISLFDDVPAKIPIKTEIKKPAVNYAQCCDAAIEDCDCVEPEYIYLPTTADVPVLKRTSMFDDPADMP